MTDYARSAALLALQIGPFMPPAGGAKDAY